MSRKHRFAAWGLYTLVCFLIMIIGFNWKVSISVSIIIGFFFGLLNEIIHILLLIRHAVCQEKDLLANGNYEVCESCNKIFKAEDMHIDDDANYFCHECWKVLVPVMKAEYKELVKNGDIEEGQ